MDLAVDRDGSLLDPSGRSFRNEFYGEYFLRTVPLDFLQFHDRTRDRLKPRNAGCAEKSRRWSSEDWRPLGEAGISPSEAGH
jgi:hypothetical protein